MADKKMDGNEIVNEELQGLEHMANMAKKGYDKLDKIGKDWAANNPEEASKQSALEDKIDEMSDKMDAAKDKVNEKLDPLKNKVNEKLDPLKNKASDTMDKAKDKMDKASSKFGDKAKESKESAKNKMADAKKQLKDSGKSLWNGNASDAKNNFGNAIKNTGSAAKDTLKAGANQLASNALSRDNLKNMSKKAGAAAYKGLEDITGAGVDNSSTGGETVNNLQDGLSKGVKGGVNAAKKIKQNGGIKNTVKNTLHNQRNIKNGLVDKFKKNPAMEAIKKAAKAALEKLKAALFANPYFWAAMGILLIAFLAVILLVAMAGLLAQAFSKVSEAFTAVANALNPTAYESFTMEDQYEILANVFADEVMTAYENMLADVESEIRDYGSQATYNEWTQILEWNQTEGQIEYDLLYTSSDTALVVDTFDASATVQGMPYKEATGRVDVYIGGYTGTVTDTQWGKNGLAGQYVDTKSKTDPNYNKGLLKVGKHLGDPDCYATGTEVYFDEEEELNNVKANIGYAAISDISYLVSGYNVSMMEAPIFDIGSSVSSIEVGFAIIKYEVDISSRIFMNTYDNNLDKHGGNHWWNIAGKLAAATETLVNFMTDKIKDILGGETSYYTYSPDLIQVTSETQKRTVYEYTPHEYDGIKDFDVIYNVKEKYCPGHSHSCADAGCTLLVCFSDHKTYCPSNDCEERTIEKKVEIPHQKIVDKYTPAGKYVFNPNDWKSYIPSGYEYVSFKSKVEKGNAYSLNRSEYLPVVKSYTHYGLDIPMSAFDVDRILKAIFETSPYYAEMTWYYVDFGTTYGEDKPEDFASTGEGFYKKITTEDQIISHYGKYINEWKYSYNDNHPITYPTIGEVIYSKGQLYDNGIDQQPYLQQDCVYLYDCACSPNYGIYKACPSCGKGTQRSYMISSVTGEEGNTSNNPIGAGDRPISSLAVGIVQDNAFFHFILDPVTGYQDSIAYQKAITGIASTAADKKTIDDYTGGQIGGTIGMLSTGSSTTTTIIGEDHDGTGGDGTIITDTSPVTSLTGSTNTLKVYNFLTSKGLSKAQVSGIMGNIQQESSFSPGARNSSSGAYGICQWLGPRQTSLVNYCNSNGFSASSLLGQLNYLWYELNTSEKKSLNAIRNCKTVASAATTWENVFERSGGSQVSKRINYAQSFYQTDGASAGVASANGDGSSSSVTNTINNLTTSASSAIQVVLYDHEGKEHYPITVLDRVLENKDTILNVLENAEFLQSELAARGLSYDQRYLGTLSNIVDGPMIDYTKDLIKNSLSYTTITELGDGSYAIGIGSWTGSEAITLVTSLINNNPDTFNHLCEANGITPEDFKREWHDANASNSSKYQNILRGLLNAGQGIQDAQFDTKLSNAIRTLINAHITDSATLALMTCVVMYFDNVNNLTIGGGEMAMFREYVMNGAINAGVDQSFETAYKNIVAWMNMDDNIYASPLLRNNVEDIYNKVKADKDAETLPYIANAALAPAALQPLLDLGIKMTESPYNTYFRYNQNSRFEINDLSAAIKNVYDYGSGSPKSIIGDCSSFVAALYYTFGYKVPASSGSWAKNAYGYKQRTDVVNMIPGDVIVWRNSSNTSGHVELYIGGGQSIGFGSEPPKIHTNWECFRNKYSNVSFYRVVE